MGKEGSAEKAVREIRRRTRRKFSAEEKVLETRDCKWSPKTHQERSVWADTSARRLSSG